MTISSTRTPGVDARQIADAMHHNARNLPGFHLEPQPRGLDMVNESARAQVDKTLQNVIHKLRG